jgi:hypothetical protein
MKSFNSLKMINQYFTSLSTETKELIAVALLLIATLFFHS